MPGKTILIFLFSILIFNVTAYSSSFKIRSTWLNGQEYVYMKDIARFYGMSLLREKTSCSLKSKYSKILYKYNSKLCRINGVTVYNSLPVKVRKIGNSWLVLLSRKDFLLLLDPILREKPLVKQNVKTVVIDPGHGGKDCGAVGSKTKEKDIVLQVARRLSKILKKSGYRAVLTRNRDVFLTLSQRPAVTAKYNGDIFISIHCNSVNSDAEGIETFIYTPQGTKSTYGGKTSGHENGNKYNKNNSRLGYCIQKYLTIMKTPDRGLKHSRFKVLRLSSKPAVLIELGFVSSETEQKKLMTPNYQYLLAYRIAQGVNKYACAVKH
ncbi:MAG: N-acetylmuramoyl-L-alanine amidase [Victivallales bacterium]|nr:N-acetylmuramoyl-L-alanine amidase [Victivallales bacterium]MCF7888952.1 N-acetylmuramoyl-L-alanine amidase [Victivallales bacterium]